MSGGRPFSWDASSESVKAGYNGPKEETALTFNNTLRNCREQMELTFRFFEANDIVPNKKQVEERYMARIRGTVPQKPTPEPKKAEIPKELQWFMNWATDRGYNTNLAYKSFRPTLKMTQKKVIYLSKEELQKIKGLELKEGQEYLDPVRDVFLFCCFTGLRHSYVSGLRRNDVKGDHIEVTTVKTADILSIELNDVSKAILEKYKDVPLKDNFALPVYTNQAMNRNIKELCKLAGIEVVFHRVCPEPVSRSL